jgi:hypothetical protein
VLLTLAEFEKTRDKIDKINARAAKKGWTGKIHLTGEKVVKTETGPAGLPVTQQFVEATIVGEPPKYDGWTFLARAEFDNESGLVVYGAPGAPPVDREMIRPQECDHCHVNRYRKHIYVVSNGERQLQVGSTCLKDFLGWDISPAWVSADESEYEPDFSGGRIDPVYSTETVLAFAWAAIQEFGFVRSGNGYSTKMAVIDAIDPRTKEARKTAEAIRPHVAEATAHAQAVRAWVLSDGFSGPGDYVQNLKNIAGGEFLVYKNFGYLVSAPQAWAKAQERDLIKRQEKADILNEWNGKEGDKLELTVTLKSIRTITGDYYTSDLYTFEGTDKRIYKWFSSRTIFREVDGKPVKITGTVKKLEEYKGSKSTVLTRVKVIT